MARRLMLSQRERAQTGEDNLPNSADRLLTVAYCKHIKRGPAGMDMRQQGHHANLQQAPTKGL